MAKTRPLGVHASPDAFQHALDALDVIGRWDWDAATDCIRADAFVALLFNVMPDEGEAGLPLATYIDAIHAEDRQRVLALIRRSAQDGSTYLTEHRVISIDGRTRWVLARGRFVSDHNNRPLSGSGILVDITQMRMSEGTFDQPGSHLVEAPLDRAADLAIGVQQALVALQDPTLTILADMLLMALGRKLAQHEMQDRRRHMN